MTDAQIVTRIREASLLTGEFTLRSGRKSKYYLDKYLFETQPDILRALGERFAQRVTPQVRRLAGAELGGDGSDAIVVRGSVADPRESVR